MKSPFFYRHRIWICLAVFSSRLLSASAEVKLPPIFSDHMVLQKSAQTPVWGQADPGEKVKVTLDHQSIEAEAGADGRWQVSFDLAGARRGPFEMTIEAKNRVVIRDVAVGEVWLAAGQSNMVFRLSRTIGGKEAVAKSSNPFIREFSVDMAASPVPAEQANGRWFVAGPQTSPLFSGVAYYFARMIQAELGCPVGVINASWGGTKAEPWTSAEALERDPDLKVGKEQNLEVARKFFADQTAYAQQLRQLLEQTGRSDRPSPPGDFAAFDLSTQDWSTASIPGTISRQPGAVWLRKDITLSGLTPNYPLRLSLPQITGFWSAYWNGEKIAEAAPENAANNPGGMFYIPHQHIRDGRNVLAIRIFSPIDPPTLSFGPEKPMAVSQPLKGEWLVKTEFALPPADPELALQVPKPPEGFAYRTRAGYLFNGMIAPIIPYGIAGTLWYQGESNADRAWQYRKLLPILIADWRGRWGRGNIPFLICQLPNFEPNKSSQPPQSWAVLREAQTLATRLPAVWQAVTYDTGEETEVHPANKRDPGERLARVALAKAYGKPIVSSGPVFASMEIRDGKAIVRFSHAEGGLVAKALPPTYRPKTGAPEKPLVRNNPQSEVEGFAICGEDRRWVWANAVIDKDTVTVSSDQAPKPQAVRYGWENNPMINLYNGAGLPAAPFRTDNFSVSTQ